MVLLRGGNEVRLRCVTLKFSGDKGRTHFHERYNRSNAQDAVQRVSALKFLEC
jgi:hypothetical protein